MAENSKVFRFKLYSSADDQYQKVYEVFLATLALRRYSFSVKMEWKSSEMSVAVVTVENWNE